MLPAAFVRGNDLRRLRLLLGALFLALSIPTAALIWQAYDQLKWEAWFEHRNQAEGLTNSIDSSLSVRIAAADRRRFTEFSFFSATGGKFSERSALAAVPVVADVPGTIGYFQIDPEGHFSSPILPDSGADPADFGIDATDWASRAELAGELQRILSDNALVRDRVIAAGVEEAAISKAAVQAGARTVDDTISSPAAAPAEAEVDEREQAGKQANNVESYAQQAFDELNQAPQATATMRLEPPDAARTESAGEAQRTNRFGRVTDLALDDVLEKKSEALLRDSDAGTSVDAMDMPTVNRERRVEKESLPPAPAAESVSLSAPADRTSPITTFESEVDPYEFSLLDSGHLVLFRKVWRDDQRYIQGMILDSSAFVRDAIAASFLSSSLAGMSDLVVSYQGDIIDYLSGQPRNDGMSSAAFDGALLYRSRLSAPLQSLQLIYTIRHLPPGPGAAVLGWTTVLIAVVFLGGFIAMYRLGRSQILLARQQQDFVSAVSHELKTPLTSIRMYGEMLREGWADDDKRQQYYEYIHDESERLSRLISNVLQLARITRNDAQVEMRLMSVSQLIDQVRSKISTQVERAGFALMIDAGNTGDCTLNVDPDCFIQIIINLVDNAIKFSRDATQKEIVISASLADNDQLVFAVRDHGPGIPRNRLRKIFELFYRTESELTRETVGTGIGLAIVRQLSIAMNGHVDVINRTPGAEFQVRFPLVSGRQGTRTATH